MLAVLLEVLRGQHPAGFIPWCWGHTGPALTGVWEHGAGVRGVQAVPAPKWGQPELPAELTQLRGRGRGVLLLQKHKLSSAPAGGETEALSGALGCALIAISPGAINAALRGGQAADPTLPPGHGPSFTHPAGFKPGGGGPRAYHSGKPGCLWGLGGGSPSSWGDHSQVLTHAHTSGAPRGA